MSKVDEIIREIRMTNNFLFKILEKLNEINRKVK
jgi:hypothetical protein